MPSLREAIAALEPKVAGDPTAMLGLARLLQQDGQPARALAMCRAALALAPQDRKLAAKPIVEMDYPRAKASRQVPQAMKRRLEARAAELYEALPAVA